MSDLFFSTMKTIVCATFIMVSTLACPAVALASNQTQTLLSDLPSFKLHVTLHGNSFQLHGKSEFDVFANSIVSDDGLSVLYDGYATFIEGHRETTYSLVNGSFYFTTSDSLLNTESTHCGISRTFPFDEIFPALNGATFISRASSQGVHIECKSGTILETSFGGFQYAICTSSGSGFTAFTSDITITVNFLNDPVRIPKIRLQSKAPCNVVLRATTLTPTALALLRGDPIIPARDSRHLKATASMVQQSARTCSCKSTPRPCIFFHGLGNEIETLGMQNTSRHFGWIHIQRHAPCCSTIKYASLDTVNYGWTSPLLQEKVCNRALAMSATSDFPSRQIHDTIIVTHSMGGLMVAGALANKACHLSHTSTWIALSAPMTGSMSSDYLMEYCNGEVRGLMSEWMFDGKCPINESVKSVAYQNEQFCSKELFEAYGKAQKAYRTHVFAVLCSSSSVGNISKYQAKYIMGGRAIPHKSTENDGLVEFQSCASGIPYSQFGKTPDSRFYECELNHADTAFKTGDGIFKSTVRPLKWFECLL